MNVAATRDALQAIFEERGRLTPVDVVDVAADPEHPLHERFEWDDETAGRAYRMVQAAALIRSVKIRVEKSPTHTVTVRAFVHVPQPGEEEDDERGQYVPQSMVAARPDLQAVVLAEMERQWRDLRRRWEHQQEFWPMVLGDEAGAA